MNKIKYVEFDIKASGSGCVNTNGSINPRTGKAGDESGNKNHIFAKQRGGQMYISKNCIRGYMFQGDAKGMMLASKAGFGASGDTGEAVISRKDMPQVSQLLASSYLGLLRGYMLTESSSSTVKRNSPLMVTDLVNQIGESNKHEVMVNHLAVDEKGNKTNTSLFSQDTWGDTSYLGRAVVSIESLQFISTDSRLGHQSVRFSANIKKATSAPEIEIFRNDLIKNIKAIGIANGMSDADCGRINAEMGLFTQPKALFSYPEEGILINNEGIHALMLETKSRLEDFCILKSKGFVRVDSVETKLTSKLQCAGIDLALDASSIPDYKCFYEKESASSVEVK